ncbi:protein-cysteine N-palmitoyltransferase HHAT [Ambystoma mexicanum]|uniref:protein-cysteine N-palmitoyltransferase HHAT n=1 Tax=Ambystoma mexicanum TaxID=8296 RepID=UPI0037E84DE2
MLLPPWEMGLYLVLSVSFHLYSFYGVYLFSREHETEWYSDIALGDSLFWGLKKDPSDFEWSFWAGWARGPLLGLFFGHAIVSKVSLHFLGALHPWCLMVYGMVACWILLGIQGLGFILLHIAISYTVAQLRIPMLSWGSSLLLLSTLQIDAVQKQIRSWYKTENEYYLLCFTVAVRCLYYTSFSLEYCWHHPCQKRDHTLLWMLLYMFYYPMFHNGPIMNFDYFYKEMQQKETSASKTDLTACILGVARLLWWWWLAELMIHLMHMHIIYNSDALLSKASNWTLGGLALAQVLFFYVKYLVLYGIPAFVVRFDGLHSLPLPRCVSTMYSFTGMWRSFDVGLYQFLMRYIYIPMGGSKSGPGEKLLSTGITFAFVAYWHGAHQHLLYWAALNWMGINFEYNIKRLLYMPVIQNLVFHTLTPKMQRRIHATLAAVATSMLILTNLVFLGGENIGQIYWDRFFVRGWPWAPLILWGCLYCYAQIGIEWDRMSW